MCREKIHLFEKSQGFGFAQAGADRCASQENNLLCGLDCLLFARAFVERRTQRAKSFSTSEFEIFLGGSVAYCDTAASIAQCEMQSHAA
jgi:hypothetical protein